MCKNNIRQTGFTLIELLVTIMIFAIISTLSYNALHTSIKQQKAQEIHHQQLFELQKTLHYLQRDITQIYHQEIVLSKSGFGITSIQNQKLLKLNYSVREKKIIRQDQTDAQNPVTLTLISDISKGSIRVLDSNNKWHVNWHKGVASPRVVEIKFEHPGWGEVKKLVFIDE